MRFEVKTDHRRFSEYFSEFLLVTVFLFFGVLFFNLVFSLQKISKFYETNYLCKLILVEKSSYNFKKLERIINQKNKQKIWDFCKLISR
tara:strand:+ start:222 stop:488 length:267 start_codon:yes stop_codon:yes gene_type:complete